MIPRSLRLSSVLTPGTEFATPGGTSRLGSILHSAVDTRAGAARVDNAQAHGALNMDVEVDARAENARAGNARAQTADLEVDARAENARAGNARAETARAQNVTDETDFRNVDARAADARAGNSRQGDARAEDARAYNDEHDEDLPGGEDISSSQPEYPYDQGPHPEYKNKVRGADGQSYTVNWRGLLVLDEVQQVEPEHRETTGGRTLEFPPTNPHSNHPAASKVYSFTPQGLHRLQRAGMAVADAIADLEEADEDELKQYVEAGDLICKRRRVALAEALVPLVEDRQNPGPSGPQRPRNWDETDPQMRNAYECEVPVLPAGMGICEADSTTPYLTFEEGMKVLRTALTPIQQNHVEWCLRYAAGKWQVHGADWANWVAEGMPTATQLVEDAQRAWVTTGVVPFTKSLAAQQSQGAWMRRMQFRHPAQPRLPQPSQTPEMRQLHDRIDGMLDVLKLHVNAPRPRPDAAQREDGGTPPDASRRRATDFNRAMTHALKVTDSSKAIEIELWEHSIKAAAIPIFGERWAEDIQKVSTVISGLQRTMSPEIQKHWMEDTKVNPEWLTATTWQQFMTWVRAQCVHEPLNEAREARLSLIRGDCTQGKTTVTDYVRNFRRLTRQVPDITIDEQVLFFQNGLCQKLEGRCRLDINGKEFTTLDALQAHALSVEVGLRAGSYQKDQSHNDTKPYRQKSHYRDRDNAPPRSGRRYGKPDGPSLNAMQGRGGRDGGRGGGGGGGGGGGRTGGRGDRNGGRGGDRKDSVRFEHPDPKAKLFDAYPTQPGISNEQALFLGDNKCCYFCFKSLEQCLKDRNGSSCPDRRNNRQLKPNTLPGAPKWNK